MPTARVQTARDLFEVLMCKAPQASLDDCDRLFERSGALVPAAKKPRRNGGAATGGAAARRGDRKAAAAYGGAAPAGWAAPRPLPPLAQPPRALAARTAPAAVGRALEAESARAAARAERHPRPRADARATALQEAKHVALARRKALLPYLDDLGYVAAGLGGAKASIYASATRAREDRLGTRPRAAVDAWDDDEDDASTASTTASTTAARAAGRRSRSREPEARPRSAAEASRGPDRADSRASSRSSSREGARSERRKSLRARGGSAASVPPAVEEDASAVAARACHARLLAEPRDEAILAHQSDKLWRSHERAEARAAAAALGVVSARADESAARDDFAAMTRRFSRFSAATKLADERADVEARGARGGAWLVRRIEEAYDSLAAALARCTADNDGGGGGAPAAEPRLGATPLVVARDLWRRFGARAPVVAAHFAHALLVAAEFGSVEALLFSTFLDETKGGDALALVLHARCALSHAYQLSLRRPDARVVDGADGRSGENGLLLTRDEAPVLAPHAIFACARLKASPLYDPLVLSVLLPTRAVERLCAELAGNAQAAARAQSDELVARGLVAQEAGDGARALAKMLLEQLRAPDGAPAFFVPAPPRARIAFKHVLDGPLRASTEEAGPEEAGGAVPPRPPPRGPRPLEYVDLHVLLARLAAVASAAPEDIVSLVKFAGGGSRLAMLDALTSALGDASRADDVAEQVRQLRRDAGVAANAAEQLGLRQERLENTWDSSKKAQLLGLRTKRVLADAEAMRCNSNLAERRTLLASLLAASDGTWTDVVERDAAQAAPPKPKRFADAETGGRSVETQNAAPVEKAIRLLRASIARACASRRDAAARDAVLRLAAATRAELHASHQRASVMAAEAEAGDFFEDEGRHVLPDHGDTLAPLVAMQSLHVRRLQAWVRRRRARLREEARYKPMTFIQFANAAGHPDRIVAVALSEQNDRSEEAAAVERDVTRALRLRAVFKGRPRQFRSITHRAEAFLRGKEADRRCALLARRCLRVHVGAWRAARTAKRFALGRFGRLLKAVLKALAGYASLRVLQRRSASKIAVACCSGPRARLEVRFRRCLGRKQAAAAQLCLGKALLRWARRTFNSWIKWASIQRRARAMAIRRFSFYMLDVVDAWAGAAKAAGVERLENQRVARESLLVDAAAFEHAKRLSAASKMNAAWRRRAGSKRFDGFLAEAAAKHRSQVLSEVRGQGLLFQRRRIKERFSKKTFEAWRSAARVRRAARLMAADNLLKRSLRRWRRFNDSEQGIRFELLLRQRALVVALVQGHAVRRRYGPVLKEHKSALKLQTSAIRPWLASRRVYHARLKRASATTAQRLCRGAAARSDVRGVNAAKMLVAAYCDDLQELRRGQWLAVSISALAPTRAALLRHLAAGDTALHRACRGEASACAVALVEEMAAEASFANDAECTPMHVLGEPLEPPAAFRTPAQVLSEQLWEEAERHRLALVEKRRFEEYGFQPLYMHDAPSGKRPARLLAGAAGAKPSRRQKKRGEIVSLAPEADEVREALVKREGKSVVKKDKAWFKAWFKQERAGQAEEDVTALALQAADKSDDSSDSGVGSEDDDSDASDEEDRVARLPAEARLAAETPRPQVAAIVEALLKHGADLEALEKLGRTPLLCAVARRDDALVHLLLSRGADTSASQFSGQTALSLSARLGDVGILRQLLTAGASVDAPGRKGRTAAHEACRLCDSRSGPRMVRALIAAGADFEAKDDFGQAPLTLACAGAADGADSAEAGLADTTERIVLQLLMARGVDVHSTDSQGRTALHYAAKFDRADAIAVLVDVGDADVSAADFGGATPLHVAALAGSPKALMALLARGALAKAVDQDGNQAVHLACRGGDVAAVETLVAYEAPLGCRNWAGLTPIGVARMYARHGVAKYLLDTIASSALGVFQESTPDLENSKQLVTRDATSEQQLSTWDRAVSDVARLWERRVVGGDGIEAQKGTHLEWRHIQTGEVRLAPPAATARGVTLLLQAAWPATVLKRQLVVTRHDASDEKLRDIGAAEYETDRVDHNHAVEELRQQTRAARDVQKCVRRQQAKWLAQFKRSRRDAARKMQRGARWRASVDRAVLAEAKFEGAVGLQRLFRGGDARADFFNFGWEVLWWRRAERALALQLQRGWGGFVARRFLRRARNMAHGPKNFADWQKAVKHSGPARRTFGIHEERSFPRQLSHFKDAKSFDPAVEDVRSIARVLRDVKFYHNRFTGVCSWDQPYEWQVEDRRLYADREQLRLLGHTAAEDDAARFLQAQWRGSKFRRAMHASVQGAKLMRGCEAEYLSDPRSLRKLAHYVLFLHVYQNDVDRASLLYQQAVSRMNDRGPADAWILCSYAVFLAATGADDWDTIDELSALGRSAPEGPKHATNFKGYDIAEGFFRAATADRPKDAWAWHNYALLRWLVFEDLSKAEELFVQAVRCDSHDALLRQNFDVFLKRRYPDNDSHDAFSLLLSHAQREMEKEMVDAQKRLAELRADPVKQQAARVIQAAWRRHDFFTRVRQRAKEGAAQRLLTAASAKRPRTQPAMLEAAPVVEDVADEAPEDNLLLNDSLLEALKGPRRFELGEDVEGRQFWFDTRDNIASWSAPDDPYERLRAQSPQPPPEDEATVDEDVFAIDDGSAAAAEVDDASADGAAAEADASQWECHLDAATGEYFWYNVESGVSQWTSPDDASAMSYPSKPGDSPDSRETAEM